MVTPASLMPVPPRFMRVAVWPAAGNTTLVMGRLVVVAWPIWWPGMFGVPALAPASCQTITVPAWTVAGWPARVRLLAVLVAVPLVSLAIVMLAAPVPLVPVIVTDAAAGAPVMNWRLALDLPPPMLIV